MDFSLASNDYTSNQKKVLLAHGLIFLIMFGIFINALIWNILFYREKVHYMRSHMCHGNSLWLIFTANQIVLYVYGLSYFNNRLMPIIEIALFVFFTIQFGMGIKIFMDVSQTKFFLDVKYKKRFHIIGAAIIYILGKVKVAMLFYYFLYDFSVGFFWVIGTVYLFVIFFAFTLYYLIYHKKSGTNYIHFFKKKKDKQLFKDLRQSIQQQEFFPNQSFENTNILDTSVDEIKLKRKVRSPLANLFVEDKSDLFANIMWSIFEDKIFEIKDLPHSAGKFVISWCHQKDITRYIYGTSTLVMKDQSTKRFSFLKYKHSLFFRHYINKNCIGLLKACPVFQNHERESKKTDLFLEHRRSLNLFSEQIIKEHKESAEARLKHFDFSQNITNSILLFEDFGIYFIETIEKENQLGPKLSVDLNLYWIDVLGKYSLLDFADSYSTFLQPVFFLNPMYLKTRTVRLSQYHIDAFLMHERLKNFDYDFLMHHDDLDGRQNSKYLIAVGRIEASKRLSNFNLIPSLGLNLGFSHNSCRKFVVIAADEGIIPFVDFLEVLFQKMLLLSIQRKPTKIENSGVWIFSRNCRLVFSNGLQLQFLLSCSSNFTKIMELLGFYHLHLIQEFKNAVPETVIQSVTVFSDEIDHQKYPLFMIKKRQKFYRIEDLLKDNVEEFDRIIVSGGDKLKTDLFLHSRLDDETWKKTIFL